MTDLHTVTLPGLFIAMMLEEDDEGIDLVLYPSPGEEISGWLRARRLEGYLARAEREERRLGRNSLGYIMNWPNLPDTWESHITYSFNCPAVAMWFKLTFA